MALAQDAAADTAVIDTIRTQTQISESDQRRIGDWIESQVSKLKATAADQRGTAAIKFRELLRTQFENASNSPAFKEQFVSRTAALATAQLGAPSPDLIIARTLHKALLDFNRPEAIPAFLAGMGSKDAALRALSASGLAAQRAAWTADKTRLEPIVSTLRDAGLESEGVVLDRIYKALSVPPPQAGAVFDAFNAIFDKRIERRRQGAVVPDGAEIMAYEFFRTPGVVAALSQPQKEQLARSVGAFLRFDAQRYADPTLHGPQQHLHFQEIDRLQRLLDGAEDILVAVVGAGKGGDVRGALAAAHPPAQVLQQAQAWVGDAGALSAAPWNLPTAP